MPNILVEEINEKSIIVKQKYFDLSILTIPILALLIPGTTEKIIVGSSSFIGLLMAFIYTIKTVTVYKGSEIVVKYSIILWIFSIKNSQHNIDRKFYNVSVEKFNSGGNSENTGTESYTILLRDKDLIVAKIAGFKDFKHADEMARKISS